MKILLVGAHGTGKTTLAKKIQEIHPRFKIIDGIHREAKQDGFEINKTGDVISQIETVRRYWNKVGARNSFISLDGMLRQTAYVICNKLPEPVIGLMKELCYIERKHFMDAIFYLPIEFLLEKDNVRNEDRRFQEQVDTEISLLLNTFYHYNYLVVAGSVDHRVGKVCDAIQGFCGGIIK